MSSLPPLSAAIALLGLANLANRLGVTYQAVRKWEKKGAMPRTEYTGESSYSTTIEVATGGQVTKEMLLARPWSMVNICDERRAA